MKKLMCVQTIAGLFGFMFFASSGYAQIFAPAVSYPIGQRSYIVVAADLNRDGHIDLAASREGQQALVILMNNSLGIFSVDSAYNVGNDPGGIAPADLDNDGDLDLAVTDYSNHTLYILLNDGQGIFSLASSYPSGGLNAHKLCAADFDKDGDIDLAVPNSGSGNLAIFMNNGDATLASPVLYTVGTFPYTVISGDVDKDGDADLVVTVNGQDKVSILLNNGSGVFGAPASYAVGGKPQSPALADFDKDGNLDLAVPNSHNSTPTVSVFKGKGDGTFQPKTDWIGSRPHTVTVADYDADGNLDMAIANNETNTVGLLLGNGDLTFQSQIVFTVGKGPNTTDVADFDGDKFPDLVVANYDNNGVPGNGVSVLMNGLIFVPGAFSKYGGNPVLDIGPTGSWDGSDVFGPRILFVDDTLRMWYTGANYGSNNDRIGYAWSVDTGKTWTKHPSNPVLTYTQSWENGWLYAPYVTHHPSQGYRMWYVGNDGHGAIGFATSPDGVVWTKHAGNPVLSPGTSAWESRWIEWPAVIETDSLRMWYGGHNNSLTGTHIGYAASPDGIQWTYKSSAPVISPTEAWEGSHLRSPRVTSDGKTYRVWYSAGSQLAAGQKIGYAESKDGRNWTKFAGNPVLQPSGSTWDANGLFSPEVFFDGSTFHMWYAGYDGAHLRIGYASVPGQGVVDAVEDQHEMVPSGFDLGQNYPNPFNPSTTIRFTLHASLYTMLTIYNILGQQVATLVNEKLDPGTHSVIWDATGFPSGVYVYRLQAGEYVLSRRMLLIK